MRISSIVIGCITIICTATTSVAIPTTITVRVKSKDAKFVGTSMGGVLITIEDVDTGKLLAKGTTTGTTGNTSTIMKTPITRGMPISDEKSSRFITTIDIDEPTLIEVTAYGPLAQRQSANKVSATQWVIPGKHITGGDAWMMELPGFVVDILSPPTHSIYNDTPKTITVTANVTMMCGCPITPGGLWDFNKYEIKALIKKNGKQTGELSLQYGAKASQFTTPITIEETGVYELIVYAYDPANGNTGLDKVTFVFK
jgi:hypothetical protein